MHGMLASENFWEAEEMDVGLRRRELEYKEVGAVWTEMELGEYCDVGVVGSRPYGDNWII